MTALRWQHAPSQSQSTWKAWVREQATRQSRAIVQHHDVNPSEYALYSGRIGGATRLAVAGILAAVEHQSPLA